MSIPYSRQSIDQSDVDAVAAVLGGDWLTQGPTVEEFENAIANVTSAPYAVAFANGTAALHGAALAAGLGPGDELITSALTFAASANCAAYVGATPRFADIDPATWNVSAESVREVVSPRTRAVVPVHFAGLPAPVSEIRDALGPEVRIIEDAAHALGAVASDGPVGACASSDMAVFSFHPVKAIAAGEGGMVTTRDPDLRDALRTIRDHGFSRPADHSEGRWWYEQRTLGFNYRLSDIHSALGRSQLRKLDGFIEARNEIAARYRAAFAAADALQMPPEPPPAHRHAYHLFAIRHRGGHDARRSLYDGLRERGVMAQVHYIPVYWHPWYASSYGYRRGMCPETEAYYSGALSIPCYPALTDAEQRYVVSAVSELLDA